MRARNHTQWRKSENDINIAWLSNVKLNGDLFKYIINQGLVMGAKYLISHSVHSVYSILRYVINRCLPKRVPFPGKLIFVFSGEPAGFFL